MTINGTTPKRRQTMQGQETKVKNKPIKSKSAINTPISSGPPSPKPKRYTHTPKSKSLTLRTSSKKDSSEFIFTPDDKDTEVTTPSVQSNNSNPEESDPNSASVTSPTHSLENHESIEQAIKTLEETIKLDQHEHAIRILSRQIQRPEYKAEYKNNLDDQIPIPTTKKSIRSNTVPSRSKPTGSIMKQKSYSYGNPQKSQPINDEQQRKQSIPSTKPKHLCTCGDIDSFWCEVCEARRFKSSFLKWTSGNKIIDEIIQETQLSTAGPFNYIEWIPFDRFRHVKALSEGGYGSLSTAVWLDGPRSIQDEKMQAKWKRDPRKKVVLKFLRNSKNITQKYLNEFAAYYKRIAWDNCMLQCYGISHDPSTKNYVIVLEYAEHGNLRKYLSENAENTSWKLKLSFACDIAKALKTIHGANLIHRDFHCGNIMITSDIYTAMSDLGLCHPIDDNLEKGNVYGVLPYLAPEVIKKQEYTKASDIYSFAFVMWEISSCMKPFGDRPHNSELASEICKGLRPKPVYGSPPSYIALMEQCWDPDPTKRPSAESLHQTLYDWAKKVIETPKLPYKVNTEFAVAEHWRVRTHTLPSAESHPGAKYTSQLFDFNDSNISNMEEVTPAQSELSQSEATKGSENAKAAETTESPKGTEAIEADESSEGLEADEGSEGAEAAVAAEAFDGSKGAEATEALEGSEGAEALEGSEGSEGAEALEGSEGSEGAEAAEALEGSESAEAAEGSEAFEGSESAEAAEAFEGSESAEAAEAFEGSESAEATGAIESSESAEVSEASEVSETFQVSEGAEVAKSVDSKNLMNELDQKYESLDGQLMDNAISHKTLPNENHMEIEF